MSQLPDPPYPANTRAKGWRFEIDYEQIEQSDTWPLAQDYPMAQHALLMMWVVSWTQVPCGSFSDDEDVIRAKCRIPRQVWDECRHILMRGWWKASDGRLYHVTLTKRVQEMMRRRRSDADRQAARRAKDHDDTEGQKEESEQSHAGQPQMSRVTPTGVRPESSTEYRQPIREVSEPTVPHPKPAGSGLFRVPPGFDRVWEAYPRKVGKDAAAKAFAKRKPDAALVDAMVAAIGVQRLSHNWLRDSGQFIPHLSTWLNGGRWMDEQQPWPPPAPSDRKHRQLATAAVLTGQTPTPNQPIRTIHPEAIDVESRILAP